MQKMYEPNQAIDYLLREVRKGETSITVTLNRSITADEMDSITRQIENATSKRIQGSGGSPDNTYTFNVS